MPTKILGRLGRLGLLWVAAALFFSSCASTRYYNQRTMFRLTDKNGKVVVDTTKLREVVNRTAKNYLIQPNDYLDVRVYTNKGERILDPNGELQFGQPGGATGGGTFSRGTTTGGRGTQRNTGQGAGATSTGSEFLVQADGSVVLPMVNKVTLAGLSLLQADSVLQRSYAKYYNEPFITTRVTNNRVFVLGSPGGQVISLTNDNMNLLEILALAGGIDGGGAGSGGTLYRYGGNASNIRIIRGDLKSPQVQQINLTTLDGMRRANLQMEPNDIVYIEPVRRPFLEALTDAAPAFSTLSIVLNTVSILATIYLYNKK